MHTVITGANRGIGLELARQCARRGDRVTGLCRQASSELRELKVDVVEGVDVRQPGPLEGVESVDLLLLNAGIWRDEVLGELNYDTIQEQFEVNTLGPLRVLEALLERLNSGARVGFVTSLMGSIAENSSGGRYGYRLTKAALNAAAVSAAHDLKPRGVSVALLHPGYVATDMTRFKGTTQPPESVSGMLTVLDKLDLDNSGGFWDFRGKPLPW